MIRIARNTRVEQVGEKSHLWRLGFADVVWLLVGRTAQCLLLHPSLSGRRNRSSTQTLSSRQCGFSIVGLLDATRLQVRLWTSERLDRRLRSPGNV